MSQTITVKIKLEPTNEQTTILKRMGKEYIRTVNQLVSEMVAKQKFLKKTSKDVLAYLPSVLKAQSIRDARSLFQKAKKSKYTKIPIMKKPICVWNNQNHSFDSDYLYFPLIVEGKVKKVPVRAFITVRNLELMKHKLGTLRIIQKDSKWIAQISVTLPTRMKPEGKIMGVDLGLKVPAVAVTSEGKTLFLGNGRQNKYVKRTFKSKRKILGESKKLNAIRTLNKKEQRYMIDQDHKVSRAIVNFAKNNNVSVIRLEQLTNIRKSTRTSRKNEKNLHSWSFYRLSNFVVYKANLAGIKVEYVNPAYTSQICPNCTERNKVQDRMYKCKCGFQTHRDRVGAMNIRYAPVVSGNS